MAGEQWNDLFSYEEPVGLSLLQNDRGFVGYFRENSIAILTFI
jgi:hypothetical protein